MHATPVTCEFLACRMNSSLHSIECVSIAVAGCSETRMWRLVRDDDIIQMGSEPTLLAPNEEWGVGYTVTLKMPEHLHCGCARSRRMILFRQHLQEYGIFPVNDLIFRLWARRLLRECPGLCIVSNADAANHVVLTSTSSYPRTPLLGQFVQTAFNQAWHNPTPVINA